MSCEAGEESGAKHEREKREAEDPKRHSKPPSTDYADYTDSIQEQKSNLRNLCNLWIRNYSFLSAVVGSNPDARRAGSHDAITAMNRNSTDTKTNVAGSVGLTSTSMLARTRVSAKAAS